MIHKNNWVNKTTLALFTFGAVISTVGCGQGFKSGGGADSSVGSASAPNISDQMAKASQANKDAQTAIADAQAAIASISDANGNIKLNLFAKSTAQVQTQGLLSPLLAKLQPTFDLVYGKALLVKQQFDSARNQLAAVAAKLDKNNPAQAATLQMIMDQLAQIDNMDAQFKVSMQRLVMNLNYALNAIDKGVNMATSAIPIPFVGFIAGMAIDYLLVDDVKVMIQTFQMKLLSL